MRIGIIGAMEEEIALLVEVMKETEMTTYYGYQFFQGQIGQHQAIVVQSGIGKVNATISATLLVEHFDVELLINTGTAGGLDPRLEVGDVVIANSLTFHDVDVTGFDYALGQMAGMPEMYYPNQSLMRLAQSACRSYEIEPKLGLIVSGDEFVNQQERIETIRHNFPKACACEMESAAIAQTAHVLNIPYVIIRAISDGADDEATTSFDEFVKIASKASAALVLAMIQQLTKVND